MKRGEKRNSNEDAFDRRKWINNYSKHNGKANQIKKIEIKATKIHVGTGKTGKRFISHLKVIVFDIGG